MKILFLTVGLSNMEKPSGFYDDLIQEMALNGNDVTAMAPCLPDSFEGQRTEGKVSVIRVRTGEFRGVSSIIKKGVAIMELGYKYKRAIKKYLWNNNFDVIFLPTPPASLVDAALMVKRQSGAKLYVILRDIHPECFKRDVVADVIKKDESLYDECKKPYMVNPLVYMFMYWKSQKLYRNADYIGCMSPGNIKFVQQIAPYVDKEKIVLLPNWYTGNESSSIDVNALCKKYDLEGKYIAIFGGTIGPAQAVWNIAMLAKHFKENENIAFVVVGRGSKKAVLEEMARKDNLTNIRFFEFMPREDYEAMLNLADVGLISIDEKYPVPTSPSKIIGYMALHKPVVAMFNEGNDYGEFYVDKPECGLWSAGMNNEKMYENFEWIYNHPEERKAMGEAGYEYYKNNLTARIIYRTLDEQLKK